MTDANQDQNTEDNVARVDNLDQLSITLVKKGIISKDQLEIVFKIYHSEENTKTLNQILVDLGFITERALQDILSATLAIKDFDLKSARLDPKAIKIFSQDIALSEKIIALFLDGHDLYVATSDIYDIVLIDKLCRYSKQAYNIVPLYAAEDDVAEAIDRYYGYEMSVDGILKEMEGLDKDSESLMNNSDEYTNPTVRLVDSIISDAVKRRVSDLHFEPEESFLRVRYRLDGVLTQVCSFHKDYWSSVAVRIKILAGMNIAEKRHPQDGRISYNHSGRYIDLRVATQPTIHGENIVIRILDSKKSLLSLESLGMSESELMSLNKILMKPEGVIIVTGPTGSGKTTTLYSILNHINSLEVNIMTVEDPVEYSLPIIRQTNIKAGNATFSFDDGIKSLMRQDPDIIFIGEIRDKEAANLVVRASMTGHKVFTSIHANDAIGVIPRILNIGIDSKMIANALVGIISQRLVRKLCNHCKEEYKCSKEECKILGIKSPVKIYRKVGCDNCANIGYAGREMICEILVMNDDLAEMIASYSSTKQIARVAIKKYGFIPILSSGIAKILAGIIDISELSRAVDITGKK